MRERVVVVGAGLAGLAAAIRLRARGHEVTVLEATAQCGGRASVIRKDGFTWDTGPTVLTAPYLVDELFALAGRDRADYVTFEPVDPFYRVRFDDGTSFDYVGDDDRLLANIAAICPADADGYRALVAHCHAIFDIGYARLADVPFDSVFDMLRVAPDLARLRNDRSVYDTVSAFLEDERLRQAFTFQPLLIGGNPFRCSSIYLLIHWLERRWGVHWARGGTHQLVAAMVRLLGEMGVPVHTSMPVDEIVVKDGRAVGVRAGPIEFPASVVVSDADPQVVYRDLVPHAALSPANRLRLAAMRPSMGLFVGFGGATGAWDLAHHTIVLGPRYRGLLEDIFERKVLADDASLYLHAPRDPGLAPEGHTSFYVLSPVPNLSAGIDWEARGERYFDALIARLDETVMPGLRDRLVTRSWLTPRYYADVLRSADGAGFGPEPRLTQSAWFRWHNRSEDVAGLYLVGAGTHPGAGIPGVLCSARALDRLIPDAAGRPVAPAPHPVGP